MSQPPIPADKRTPSFVVLQRVDEGQWRYVAEVARRPGLTARAARAQAILDATGRDGRPDESFAVVLSSEWRVALDN